MRILLHRHLTHPWVDKFGHAVAVDTARRVARDIALHERWGAGNEGAPVYDMAGEGGGRYLGDLADGTVRCRVGGPIVTVPNRRAVDEVTLTEQVYRLTLPQALLWWHLRRCLAEAIAAGRLVENEPIDDAAGRLLRHGYTLDTLTAELGGTRPLGKDQTT